MDGTVFGFGIVGVTAAVAGAILFVGQHSRLADLAAIPTSVALTRQFIKRKRARNASNPTNRVAWLDDSAEALITGTVVQHNDQSVPVETAAQQQKTGGKVAAVHAVVTKHDININNGQPQMHSSKDAWTTFEVHDDTGGIVCPKHTFQSNDALPKTDFSQERWESEQGWFGSREVKRVASFTQSLHRGTSDVGFEVTEASLPFGATVTLHGRVRLVNDTTLVVETPVSISEDNRATILAKLIQSTTRKKILAITITSVGFACIGYAVWKYLRERRRLLRLRSRREDRTALDERTDVDDEDDVTVNDALPRQRRARRARAAHQFLQQQQAQLLQQQQLLQSTNLL